MKNTTQPCDAPSTVRSIGLRLVCVCGLGDTKLTSKIQPLIASELVEQILLVRRKNFSAPKVICYSPPGWMGNSILLGELYRLTAILYLCSTKFIHATIGLGALHGLYAAVAGLLFRKPFIQLLLGNNDFKFYKRLPFGHKLWNSVMGGARFVGVRGMNTKAKLEREGMPGAKIFIPHNVFNFSEFKPALTMPKKFDVVAINLLEPFKRLDVMLHAVAKVRKQHEQLQVAIVGGGLKSDKETKRLRVLSQKLGLQQTVLFTGRVESDKVVDYLHLSRVYVMTSEGDGLPMAMIEAMSCGLPCVVPDDADITTVASHEHNALVVALGDVDGFASAISRLLDDEDFYTKLSDGALQLRSEKDFKYSLGNVRRIWEQVLVQLPGAPGFANSDGDVDQLSMRS